MLSSFRLEDCIGVPIPAGVYIDFKSHVAKIENVEVIPNFTLEEVSCNCGCGLVILQWNLLFPLHAVRTEYGSPIDVTSWCRCWDWNIHEGGKKYSYHRFGKAIDMRPACEPMSQRFIQICKRYFPFVLIYPTFTHNDIRGARRV